MITEVCHIAGQGFSPVLLTQDTRIYGLKIQPDIQNLFHSEDSQMELLINYNN